MTNMANDQRDFMYMGNQTTTEYNEDQIELYTGLIAEEFNELITAYESREPEENILKEATDLLVVTLGFIHSFGVDPNEVWKLVHKNNMFKVNEQVVKDEHGKIQKSPESKARKEKMMLDIKKLLEK